MPKYLRNWQSHSWDMRHFVDPTLSWSCHMVTLWHWTMVSLRWNKMSLRWFQLSLTWTMLRGLFNDKNLSDWWLSIWDNDPLPGPPSHLTTEWFDDCMTLHWPKDLDRAYNSKYITDRQPQFWDNHPRPDLMLEQACDLWPYTWATAEGQAKFQDKWHYN